jgi:predicted ferric reductase
VNDVMWYLTRSTGIVATVLAIAALVWGFLFSARATGDRRRPNWWLDLHNWLGGAALAFTVIHVATAYLDRDLALGIVNLFVPGTADSDRLAIAWGVVAAWTFTIAVFTSWPKRRFDRRTWRLLHLGSVVGTALAIVHALQLGSDAGSRVAQGVVLALVAVGVYGLGVRVFGLVFRER